MPHINAVSSVKMISPLNRRSLHISELWTGWDTLELVFILEHEYQTSKTRIISFSQTFKTPVWCELKGRKVEISARRGGSAAWQKNSKSTFIKILFWRPVSAAFLFWTTVSSFSAFSSFRISIQTVLSSDVPEGQLSHCRHGPALPK